MASTYGYLTLAVLEAFTKIDYSGVDATAFADASVEATITAAEEVVNSILGVSTAQTVTNAITSATKYMSAWLINQQMDSLGYATQNTNALLNLSWKEILEFITTILAQDTDVGVDSIPMSGADRYYSGYGYGTWR